MSWRRNNFDVGPESAIPLGNRRRNPPPIETKERTCRSVSVPHKMRFAPYMSRDKLEEARRLHQENVKRAQAAAHRQRNGDRAIKEKQIELQKEESVRKQSQLDVEQNSDRHRNLQPSRKRPSQITETEWRSRTSSIGGWRSKSEKAECILMWQEEGLGCTQNREVLIERALREGCPYPKQTNDEMIRDAIKDGLVIRGDSEGINFYTNGLDTDPWTKAIKWKELVSGLKVTEGKDKRLSIVSDGGKSCTKIGQGTFNIVLSYPSIYTASDLPSNVAWRVTRPDRDESGEYRYHNICTTMGETKNAIFASSNRIGVSVYGVAAFEAMRPGRTMRHGIVMAMQRAECDLFRSMDSMQTEADGLEAAEKIIDLLFRVSRLGIAFTDIKPANILVFKDGDGEVFYRLTDYDPAFFIMTDKDWRSLFLLNLAFLSAHVHNSDFGAASRGWKRAVSPILDQLVLKRDVYDSKWLFDARSVAIKFREPRDTSDFELQRNLTAVWYSYFVKRSENGPSVKHYNWCNLERNNDELYEHWERESKRISWPESWTKEASHSQMPGWEHRHCLTPYDEYKKVNMGKQKDVSFQLRTSLIKQMVDFALGRD